MESEQSQNFNERLSQWVANQGFWFQIRYSMAGTGSAGNAMFHLLRLAFRLFIFLLIVAAGAWIYLVKMTDSKKFSDGLKDKLKAGLFASEAELGSVSRTQGNLEISRLACQGGKETFFSSLDARNLSCKMGLLDTVTGHWNAGTVSMSQLNMEIRAGADDAESAALVSKAIFNRSATTTVDAIDINDTNLRWGYSDRTKGSIEKSVLKLQRVGEGIRLSFRGGKFSQNWLQGLDIVNLVITCDSEGLVFEKAEFRSGQGTVDLTGLKIAGGDRPLIDGVAKIRKLDLDNVLASSFKRFIEGTISGDFKVTGSTNSPEGIGFEGEINLQDSDAIILRQQFHLLQTLSNEDYVRNYHRVPFTEGSLHLKTTNGGMEAKNVALKSGDLLTLEGNLKVRTPTPEETKIAIEKGEAGPGALYGSDEDPIAQASRNKHDDEDFTLRRAAKEAKRLKEGPQVTDGGASLFDRVGSGLDLQQLEAEATERSARTLRYEGLFKITIPSDAFERSPKLAQDFPVDPKTNRIPLMVPIEGNLYELTLKQAEEIYATGRR